MGPISAVKHQAKTVPGQGLGEIKAEFKSFLPAYPLVTGFSSPISSQFSVSSVLLTVFDNGSLIILFLYKTFARANFERGSKLLSLFFFFYSLFLTSVQP